MPTILSEVESMFRVQLTAVELGELKRRTHLVGIKSRVRDRLEMVRLAH